MKVYSDESGEKRLVGRADVPESVGLVFEVPLFGGASIIRERYTVGTVTHLPPNGGAPVAERAVLLAQSQPAEILPGWSPLQS
jgi:hypothetical protein